MRKDLRSTLTKQYGKTDNPYQAPIASLVDDATDHDEWDENRTALGYKLTRWLLFGRLSSFFVFMIIKIVADSVLLGWEILITKIGAILLEICGLVGFGGYVLLVATVRFYWQRRRKTLKEFVSRHREEIGKWYSGPLVWTLFGVVLGYLWSNSAGYLLWEGQSVVQIAPWRVWTVSGLLVVLAFGYLMCRYSSNKAKIFLNQISLGAT